MDPDHRAQPPGYLPLHVCGVDYQGRAGQRFFARLREAGVIPHGTDGYEDDVALRAVTGFTDIVKRPTASARDVSAEEYAHGRELLEAKLDRFRAELVIFTFKKTVEILFGRFTGNGLIPNLRLVHSDVFVMPGPYETGATAQATLRGVRHLPLRLDPRPQPSAVAAKIPRLSTEGLHGWPEWRLARRARRPATATGRGSA
jgi:G:T/U-mismatch repair DNA glycosylase